MHKMIKINTFKLINASSIIKGLDDALKIIKARSGSLQSSNTSQQPSSSSSSTRQQKPQSGKIKFFGDIDDEDDQDDTIVQHVPQGISGQQKREYSFRGPKNNRGFTSSSYISDENNTNHSRLHKPGHQYFGDKLQRLQRHEEESKNKLSSDVELLNCKQELKKVKDMILDEKAKIYICKPCKRKFPSQDILEKHEQISQNHKKLCTEQAK